MIAKVKSRLDALALALGGVSMAGAFGVLPYGAVPTAAPSRIITASDEKLDSTPPPDCPDFDPDCANAGWVT